MAMLLGAKWSTMARSKVQEAISLGLVPRNGEYTLVESTDLACAVMVYERSGGRSSKSGSTSFFTIEWDGEENYPRVAPVASLARKASQA